MNPSSRLFVRSVFVLTTWTATWGLTATMANGSDVSFAQDSPPPNVVFILCDNLGYGDIGCFGSTLHRTPSADRLSREGIRLTSFYSASGVCTPSRAALMTGCYPPRVGLHLTDPDGAVLRPVSPNGLHPDEVTIAEVLKSAGYQTACIGKWHLGDQPAFLPTRQGFDQFFGIPYSDDMTPREGQPWPPLPLMRQETVIEAPVDRDLLTKRYTEEAVQFIQDNKSRPFFLYLPHAMPGSTAHPFASNAFKGHSANGSWGDTVEELDWSTGKILEALADLELEERTIVIWTSDNGAPQRKPPQGSNLPLNGWGYSTMEGGMRVPCVVRWTGHIPADTVSDELTTMMDWLPTLAALAGVQPPEDRPIDGKDISDLLIRPADTKSPHDAFLYYYRDQLQAIRDNRWKLHLARTDKQVSLTGKTQSSPARLYDLQADIGEQYDVASRHPNIVERLTAEAAVAIRELGDAGTPGTGQRAAGLSEPPVAQVLKAE